MTIPFQYIYDWINNPPSNIFAGHYHIRLLFTLKSAFAPTHILEYDISDIWSLQCFHFDGKFQKKV